MNGFLVILAVAVGAAAAYIIGREHGRKEARRGLEDMQSPGETSPVPVPMAAEAPPVNADDTY